MELKSTDVPEHKQNRRWMTTQSALSNTVQEGAAAVNSPLETALAGPIIFALFRYIYLNKVKHTYLFSSNSSVPTASRSSTLQTP